MPVKTKICANWIYEGLPRQLIFYGFLSLLFCTLSPIPTATAQLQPATSKQDVITKVETYQPNHKPAEELASAIRNLYSQDLAVVVSSGQILLRGHPSYVEQSMQLAQQLDQPRQTFNIELSSHPTADKDKQYSTKSRSLIEQTFTLSDDTELIVLREQISQQISGKHFRWLEIETEPTEQEFLKISMQSAQKSVHFKITHQRLENGIFQTRTHQVSGPLEEWLAIYIDGGENVVEAKNTSSNSRYSNSKPGKKITTAIRNALYIRASKNL